MTLVVIADYCARVSHPEYTRHHNQAQVHQTAPACLTVGVVIVSRQSGRARLLASTAFPADLNLERLRLRTCDPALTSSRERPNRRARER